MPVAADDDDEDPFALLADSLDDDDWKVFEPTCGLRLTLDKAQIRAWSRWLDGKLPFAYTASCDDILAWCRARGVLYDEPEPGDFFFVMKSANDAQHIGFVAEDITAARFGSIEGNASDPDAPPTHEGWGVFERKASHPRARKRGPGYKYGRWREAIA